MSRDWAPFEHYLNEQEQIKNGYGDIFSFMENLRFRYNDGKEEIIHSSEEMVIRRQFPMLGKLLMNADFMELYEKLSHIPGGIDFLHQKDDELADLVKSIESRSDDINEDTYLFKWFLGKLDENFYYSERNNVLFCEYILLDAQLSTNKVWVCAYKDALGYQDDNDNLTHILLSSDWLADQLRESGVGNLGAWYVEHTADDTDGIARKALAEGVILECEDKNIKLDCIPEIRALCEEDREQVEILDDLSGNNVSWGLDAEEYAWGVFVGDELVGYCTIGGADDTGHDEFEAWSNESLCLSDVFVKREHRNKGYASRLIGEALKQCNPNDKETVFITLLDDRLTDFYYSLGFKALDYGVLARIKNAPSLESQIGSAVQLNNKNTSVEPRKDTVER